ncbi:hypothetical protein FHG87_022329 [Trinorchestia longiramus]|nr:hypothetical protein FHG87_022329 [Trinorchestia longiramus]
MGVGVMQTKNELLLEQSAYTKALLSRFGIDKANSVATPVDINADPVTTSDEVEECDKDLVYQSAVCSLFQPPKVIKRPRNSFEDTSCLQREEATAETIPALAQPQSGLLQLASDQTPQQTPPGFQRTFGK